MDKLKEQLRLTEEEILAIYKKHHWIIFEPDALRAVTIAEAQLTKVLSNPRILVKDDNQDMPLDDDWQHSPLEEEMHISRDAYYKAMNIEYEIGQRKMLEAGFVKAYKFEEK